MDASTWFAVYLTTDPVCILEFRCFSHPVRMTTYYLESIEDCPLCDAPHLTRILACFFANKSMEVWCFISRQVQQD